MRHTWPIDEFGDTVWHAPAWVRRLRHVTSSCFILYDDEDSTVPVWFSSARVKR